MKIAKATLITVFIVALTALAAPLNQGGFKNDIVTCIKSHRPIDVYRYTRSSLLSLNLNIDIDLFLGLCKQYNTYISRGYYGEEYVVIVKKINSLLSLNIDIDIDLDLGLNILGLHL
ncbi:hypothetical protein H4219_003080 [Mycoemilia scoparia]|uniref:Uncharacterized protein n=1 Tax=Mycoemilia scoparia TaxID=417184 RepID=A0A9W7ZWM0_9FUNG|nr:hypothetical protein H4219_003080 [Mycoemilia scoparia]